MKGRVSRYSAEQIEMIVEAVTKYGASKAPEHLPFSIKSQLCQYYWRKAHPEAPIRKRPRRKVVA